MRFQAYDQQTRLVGAKILLVFLFWWNSKLLQFKIRGLHPSRECLEWHNGWIGLLVLTSLAIFILFSLLRVPCQKNIVESSPTLWPVWVWPTSLSLSSFSHLHLQLWVILRVRIFLPLFRCLCNQATQKRPSLYHYSPRVLLYACFVSHGYVFAPRGQQNCFGSRTGFEPIQSKEPVRFDLA